MWPRTRCGSSPTYFGIPYPAEKLDLVAIPDFAFGAMENLGCVTFRETALLVDRGRRRALRARAGRRRRRPRDRPHVVRRPRHHAVVERDLAERGLRHLHGGALRRRLPARVGALGRASGSSARRPGRRRPAHHPPHRVPGRAPRRGRGDVRRPHVPKGRRACCACSSSTSGPTTFRDGVRRYLDQHCLRATPRRRTCGTPSSRPAASRCATIMDSWILQGGHPVVSCPDGRRHACPQAPFAYGPPTAESAIGERWSVPVIVRPVGRRRGREHAACEHEPPRRRRSRDAAVVNAGGWGVYRVAYERRAARHWLAGRSPPSSALERANLFARHLGIGRWPAGPRSRRLPGACRRPGRRDRARHVRHVAGALALCDRAADDGPRPAARPRDDPARCSAPVFEPLGWEPVRRRGRAHPQPACRCCSATLGTSGRTRRSGPRRRRRFDAAAGAAPPLDPDLERHPRGRGRRGGPATTRPSTRATATPATPQEEQRYLTRLAAFPDTELGIAHFRPGPAPRCGPRTRPISSSACSPTASPGRPCSSG